MSMKYIAASIFIAFTLGAVFVYSQFSEETQKEKILFHKHQKSYGFSKPRSSFKIYQVKTSNPNVIALTVEVIGGFKQYNFQWLPSDPLQIINGDSQGTVDTSLQKAVTHEIELSHLHNGDKVVFEVFVYDNNIKYGASHIYTHRSVSEEEFKTLKQQTKPLVNQPKIKIMQ